MRLILLVSVLLPLFTEAYQLQPPPTAKLNLKSAHPETYRIEGFSSSGASNNQQSTKLSMSTPSDDNAAPNSSLVTNVLNTIGASTSILVAGTFFVVLALQRDALMVSFFMGAITNGALSKVLKKILNQDRPSDNPETVIEKPSDKGMPSSHAMSLGFIGTFTMLTLPWTQFIIPFYVAISLYYRVQSRLHTVEQVAVGMAFGVSNGFMWRYLVDGRNPMGINVMDFVTTHFLNDQGVLPTQLLVVPALAGAVVVGSLERKISKFIKKKKSE